MTKIRKILYIITQSSWGGAQKYVYTLASNFRDDPSFEIIVAGGEESAGEMVKKLQNNNVKFIPIKNLVREINPLKDLLVLKELKKLIDQEKPDIIHLNSSKAGAVGAVAARLARHRAKVIYTVHGWVFNESLNPVIKVIYLLIEKLTAGLKDYFICISELDKAAGIKRAITPPGKVSIVHNGIDIINLQFLPQEAALEQLSAGYRKPTNKIIGTIANFYATKGLNYLIETINVLVNDYQIPITLIIIGDGDLRPELEKLIKQYNLNNNIILAGKKESAAKYLRALDIYVCSSTKEGFPYTILEAMAAGVPIIATNVGGMPEIIQNEVNGLLIEAKNVKALTEKISTLLENQNLREKISSQARRDVGNKFSEQEMLKLTEAVYFNLSK